MQFIKGFSVRSQNTPRFMQKDTQPSQTCFGGRTTPNRPNISAVDASLLMGIIH
jgi:hypothetical protein